jgi:hypothetical protein
MHEESAHHPPATPHDPVEELLPDLYWVHGSVEFGPGRALSRNMAIVRRGRELSLINAVRLSAAGEAQLAALGEITNVVRIGNFHAMDDRYYVEVHGAKLWCLPGQQARPEPAPDELLAADHMPFDGAALHVFAGANFPECALILEQDGGVLLTADSLQYWADWSNCSEGMSAGAKQMGFSLTMLVGPPWLRGATPEGGSLEGDFRRLLDHDFEHMLGAHGGFYRGGAKEAVAAAIARAFPAESSA